jgi:Ca2+-binding RTX toxin-like protein
VLIGGADGDRLIGGLGKDALRGDAGADYFDFNTVRESVVGAKRDVVTVRRSEGDRIDLRTIDADTDGTANNQAFQWVNTGDLDADFTGVDGQLRYASGLLMGDVNGDRQADFEIKIVGALTAADVIL